ncbi:predicted protein [Lichtheimia corymbifera JMRC:FSU:9682]|uniref:Uncharacterized protein n=1 Tax=Lichtheimia corymbifera JMRC:FSU:9682 TaxID=1263082 RepID=A0A068RVT7_9FUNG|nr:predicted protein [Lichtheimia corymbifera JMRC:FSU:9682]
MTSPWPVLYTTTPAFLGNATPLVYSSTRPIVTAITAIAISMSFTALSPTRSLHAATCRTAAFAWTADSHCIEAALFMRINLLQDIRIPMDDPILTIDYYCAMQAFFTWLSCEENHQASD